MKTTVHSNHTEVVRQASRYTMHGLIDPRLLEPTPAATQDSWFAKVMNYLASWSVIGSR